MLLTMLYVIIGLIAVASMIIWVIVPRRALWWANRVRVAKGYGKIPKLERGHREEPCACSLSRSLPGLPSVWYGSIQWPNMARAEEFTRAWKGVDRHPDPQSYAIRVRQHPSTMLFAIFFDWGLYPRLTLDPSAPLW